MKRLLQKYHSLSVSLKASVWFIISMLFQRGINIITTPVFTALMTKEEYGTYAVFNTWYNIFLILCTFNLFGGIFNSIIHKYEGKEDEITSSTMGFQITLTALMFGLYTGYTFAFGDLQGLDFTLGCLVFAQILVNIPTSLWLAKSKYQFKYVTCAAVMIGQALATLVLSISAVYVFSSHRVYARIGANVTVMAVVAVCVFLMLLRRSPRLFSTPQWKYLLLLGLPLVVHYLAQDVMSQVDQLILDHYHGEAVVAEYNLAHQLAWIFTILVTAINAAFIPWVYRRMDEKRYAPIGKVSTLIFCLIGSVTLAVSLVAPEVILFFGHGEYDAGAPLLPLLISNVVLIAGYDLFSNIEFFYSKTLIASVATLVCAVLNFTLNLIFIPKYGMIAACCTTLASYLFLMIIHFFVMRVFLHRHELPDLFASGRVWLLTLVFIPLNIGTIFLQDYLWVRYLILGCGVLGVGIIAYLKRNTLLAMARRGEEKDCG